MYSFLSYRVYVELAVADVLDVEKAFILSNSNNHY